MKHDQFGKLQDFLNRLDDAHISYRLSRNRLDGVSVEITVPGQRWEVDFLDDGTVDVERFIGNGQVEDESALAELFARFSDKEEMTHHDVAT